MRISILINTRDRHGELGLLLQSLRTQTYQEFDIFIRDESQTPVFNNAFLPPMFNRLKLEGHGVFIEHSLPSFGVCHARNALIEKEKEWNGKNPLLLRLDDDCMIEPDYISKLVDVINLGYGVATGVIPLLAMPEVKRETRFVKPFICRHEFDKEGNITVRNDDLGFTYIEEEIIPCMQFRTNCLLEREVFQDFTYPRNLSSVGFREELWASVHTILKGYTIGCHTGAVAHHLQTPSGGTRCQDYPQKVALDEETTNKWLKEKFKERGDFFNAYQKRCRVLCK